MLGNDGGPDVGFQDRWFMVVSRAILGIRHSCLFNHQFRKGAPRVTGFFKIDETKKGSRMDRLPGLRNDVLEDELPDKLQNASVVGEGLCRIVE